MKIKQDYRKTVYRISAFYAGLSALASFAGVFFPVQSAMAIRFIAFQIFLLGIPGACLTMILFRNRTLTPVGFICVSYAFGYALNIIEYFATVCIGLGANHALLVAVLFTLLLVAVTANKGSSCSVRSFSRTDIPFAVLFLVFLILVFLEYSARYTAPTSDDPIRVYHADALFWVENSAALKKGFPPEEFRLSGTQLYYHYFASIWVAFASLVTGVDTFSLSYALYPLGKSLLLFGGLYAAASVWIEKERTQIIFLFILLFTTGLEKYSIVNYVAHILTLPFGFDIAYAYGAYFLAGIYLQYKEKLFSPALTISTVVAFLMCAGHKAPLALIYLVFAGIICLYWLIRKQPAKALVNGGSVILCFTAVMVVCVGFLTGAESRVNAGKFTHCGLLMASPLYEDYQAVVLSGASAKHKLLTYMSSMVKLILSVQPVILFLVFVGIIVLIVRKKADIIDASLLATFLAGMCMGLFNAQEGVSQMYYCMAAFIPGVLFGIRNYGYFTKKRQKLATVLFSIVLLFSFYLFSSSFHPQKKYDSTADTLPSSLQFGDYEALCWVRNNTPLDSVIVTDRSVILEIDNYMYYGTFSERANYLEGDRYFYGTYVEERNNRRETIKALYCNDPLAVDEIKAAGVDYIIQTKWISPDYKGYGAEKLFETDTATVWKVE